MRAIRWNFMPDVCFLQNKRERKYIYERKYSAYELMYTVYNILIKFFHATFYRGIMLFLTESIKECDFLAWSRIYKYFKTGFFLALLLIKLFVMIIKVFQIRGSINLFNCYVSPITPDLVVESSCVSYLLLLFFFLIFNPLLFQR